MSDALNRKSNTQILQTVLSGHNECRQSSYPWFPVSASTADSSLYPIILCTSEGSSGNESRKICHRVTVVKSNVVSTSASAGSELKSAVGPVYCVEVESVAFLEPTSCNGRPELSPWGQVVLVSGRGSERPFDYTIQSVDHRQHVSSSAINLSRRYLNMERCVVDFWNCVIRYVDIRDDCVILETFQVGPA